MKILLLPHAGSGNHGCEAIVRGTLKIIRNAQFTLFSNRPGDDYRVGLDEACQILGRRNRLSPSYAKAFLFSRLKIDPLACARHCYGKIVDVLPECDAALSIGGDNYCYGGVNSGALGVMNSYVRKAHKKFVLWGCSIDPDVLEIPAVVDDLKAFDRIVARESITADLLQSKGFENGCAYPDPAFQLERMDLPLPERFVDGNTVGINVSPMIIGYEKNPGAVFANYEKLIESIFSTSDMQVALIPHVVLPENDDRIPLQRLYQRFVHTGRVVMITDHPASVLKGYIARCRFLIAARTHASIAGYSENVPTLVVGYSIKARGIARDLFGSEEGYVIPVQSLEKSHELTDAFQWLREHETAIRENYAAVMPRYKAKALDAVCEVFPSAR